MFLTQEPIDLANFLSRGVSPASGAECSFVGIVRDHDHGRKVCRLHYEAYASMAEKMIQTVVDETKERWAVQGVCVVHRVGTLEIGEAAVAIRVDASHRDEAFKACRFVIDQIKHRVPIWKKEMYADGSKEWVMCLDASACH